MFVAMGYLSTSTVVGMNGDAAKSSNILADPLSNADFASLIPALADLREFKISLNAWMTDVFPLSVFPSCWLSFDPSSSFLLLSCIVLSSDETFQASLMLNDAMLLFNDAFSSSLFLIASAILLIALLVASSAFL